MTSSAFCPSVFAPSLMPSASENTVRQSSSSASQVGGRRRANDSIDQTSVGERVVAFLRSRHPLKTADHVSAETGVPAGTVQKWLDRGSAPNAAGYTRLWLAYGPAFLVATAEWAPAWLDAAHRGEAAAQLKAEIAALEIKLAGVRP